MYEVVNTMKKPLHSIPWYQTVDSDMTLVGITHDEINPLRYRLSPKLHVLRRFVNTRDHLFFEGTKRTHEFNRRRFTHEQLALLGDQTHTFLDEEVSTREQLERHGVSRVLYYCFETISCLYRMKGKFRPDDPLDVSHLLRTYFTKATYFTPLNVSVVDLEMAVSLGSSLNTFFVNKKEVFEACVLARKEYAQYKLMVRDYEIYAPALRRARREIDGKKGVIIGASHVKPLADLLETDDDVPFPLTWDEYVSTVYNPKVKHGIDFLHRVADIVASRT